MDPVITKLNKLAGEKVGQFSPTREAGLDKPYFKKSFDQTMTERLLERIKGDYGAGNEMTVLSAENIHVKTQSAEVETKSFSATEKYFDLFKEMNSDILSLDSAIETLSTPGFKVSPHQLLSLQAGVAQATIMAEAVSRATDTVARGIQTIVNTQV